MVLIKKQMSERLRNKILDEHAEESNFNLYPLIHEWDNIEEEDFEKAMRHVLQPLVKNDFSKINQPILAVHGPAHNITYSEKTKMGEANIKVAMEALKVAANNNGTLYNEIANNFNALEFFRTSILRSIAFICEDKSVMPPLRPIESRLLPAPHYNCLQAQLLDIQRNMANMAYLIQPIMTSIVISLRLDGLKHRASAKPISDPFLIEALELLEVNRKNELWTNYLPLLDPLHREAASVTDLYTFFRKLKDLLGDHKRIEYLRGSTWFTSTTLS